MEVHQANINQTINTELRCANCEALLGAEDQSAEGRRLYKSSLSVKSSLDADWETFPPEIFISSQLLSLSESSAARKFVVHCDDNNSGLLVSFQD
jgi:HECT-like Ubiquitin-conjugating enzyme (E2)-binding